MPGFFFSQPASMDFSFPGFTRISSSSPVNFPFCISTAPICSHNLIDKNKEDKSEKSQNSLYSSNV